MRELTFADSSLILDLAMVARRLRQAGRLIRICGPQPQVWRVDRDRRACTGSPACVVERPALA